MNNDDGPVSSDRKVADKIVARFVQDSLLPHSLAQRTIDQLGDGQMKEEDWRLLAENALQTQARNNEVQEAQNGE